MRIGVWPCVDLRFVEGEEKGRDSKVENCLIFAFLFLFASLFKIQDPQTARSFVNSAMVVHITNIGRVHSTLIHECIELFTVNIETFCFFCFAVMELQGSRSWGIMWISAFPIV